MTAQQILTAFFDTPAGTMIIGLFGLAVVDLVLGVIAAVRDGVFQLEAISAWCRSVLMGRLLMPTVLRIAGYLLGGLRLTGVDIGSQLTSPGAWLTTIGLGAAGTVLLGLIGSIQESLQPKPGTRAVPEA